MTIRCDHCRGSLGLIIHRYWRMRFCSEKCMQAYRHRLEELTEAKIISSRSSSGALRPPSCDRKGSAGPRISVLPANGDDLRGMAATVRAMPSGVVGPVDSPL